MDTATACFRNGHRHIRRLLEVFSYQLNAFEHGWLPNVSLMSDVVSCLDRYAGTGSEAYESRLLDRLAESDRRFAPARLVLTTEHGMIHELGERCLAILRGIDRGVLFARSELLLPAQRFQSAYRAHLRREERYLRLHPCRIEYSLARIAAEQLSLPEQPIRDFPDLHHRITQAMTRWGIDHSGQLLCSACAADAEFEDARVVVRP